MTHSFRECAQSQSLQGQMFVLWKLIMLIETITCIINTLCSRNFFVIEFSFNLYLNIKGDDPTHLTLNLNHLLKSVMVLELKS